MCKIRPEAANLDLDDSLSMVLACQIANADVIAKCAARKAAIEDALKRCAAR